MFIVTSLVQFRLYGMFFCLLATGACTSGFLIYISFRIKASFDIPVLFNMPSCHLDHCAATDDGRLVSNRNPTTLRGKIQNSRIRTWKYQILGCSGVKCSHQFRTRASSYSSGRINGTNRGNNSSSAECFQTGHACKSQCADT